MEPLLIDEQATETEECENCGKPAVALYPDCDPGVGYHSTIALCGSCNCKRGMSCGSCKVEAL